MTLETALLVVTICLVAMLALVAAIHVSFRAPRRTNDITPDRVGLFAQACAIADIRGGRLSGWWLPARPGAPYPDTTVVLMHGWGANKSDLLPLANPFHAAGYCVLMLDAHNHGDSDARGVSSMPKFAEDVQAALDWLQQQHPDESRQRVLVGHSVGAAAVLLAAARGAEVDAVVAMASFVHPKRMMKRHLHRLRFLPGLVNLIAAYVQWVIGHRFDDIAPIISLKRIQVPVLLVHGDADRVIPIEDHQGLCQAAPNSVKCLSVPGADHDSIDRIEAHFGEVQAFLAGLHATGA